MAKRKPLSKKIRFEVFKRDSFICQYCGRKTPEVILEIDHIVSVKDGGDNALTNLLTVCFDCNRGKGSEKIDKICRDDISILNEEAKLKEEQLKEYYKYKGILKARETRTVNQLVNIWSDLNGNVWGLTDKGKSTLRRFLKHLDKYEIEDAMEISTKIDDIDRRYKYFCGVCWHKIKEDL